MKLIFFSTSMWFPPFTLDYPYLCESHEDEKCIWYDQKYEAIDQPYKTQMEFKVWGLVRLDSGGKMFLWSSIFHSHPLVPRVHVHQRKKNTGGWIVERRDLLLRIERIFVGFFLFGIKLLTSALCCSMLSRWNIPSNVYTSHTMKNSHLCCAIFAT